MFSLRKNQQLLNQLEDFFNIIKNTIDKTLKTYQYVIKHGIDNSFMTMAEEISELERDTDEIRKEIENKMFSQSLLPETREDILEIIEEMDNVADSCKRAIFIIVDQKTLPIEKISNDITELLKVGIDCFNYTVEAAHDLLGKMSKVRQITQKVNDYEHIGDKLERKMIQAIFAKKSLTPGEKFLQKELVLEIGDICDMSKHTAQKIIIASIKRKV